LQVEALIREKEEEEPSVGRGSAGLVFRLGEVCSGRGGLTPELICCVPRDSFPSRLGKWGKISRHKPGMGESEVTGKYQPELKVSGRVKDRLLPGGESWKGGAGRLGSIRGG